jgi:hypothetical protein
MKSFWLAVRCGLEGILGAYMMVAFVAEAPKAIINLILRGSYNIAYTFGALAGVFVLGVLGYYIFRDAVRVGRRVRTKPEISQNPIGKL